MAEQKQLEYAVKIGSALGELFNEESELFISQEEIAEGDNLTDFLHALANMVPTQLHNTFTSNNISSLEFNHLANRLVFQNSKKVPIADLEEE